MQRALLSEPGMTYKYFNTRLFGFPWKQVEHDSSIASKARYAFGKLNEILRDKGLQLRKEKLNTTSSDDSYEGCNYNVSLMNFFDPSQVKLESWKEDPFYKMGRMAITWHSDPCEPGSTVAVYQYDKYNCEQNKSSEWAVGIRPYWDVETPSLKFTFESGDAYFMLNGFNENFQHCVIAGTTIRFSSTHRRILV